MLVKLDQILSDAQKNNYAVPAFNVYNMETVMGVINAAEHANAPVILQSYSRLFTNEEAYYLAPAALAAAHKARVPVCFHLDHGAGIQEVVKGLRYGCTGIMIDASSYEFEKNIELTSRVTELCGAVEVPVEGELGHIGSVNDEAMGEYTKVSEAAEYVERTKVSALAILVGTAHGRYKKAPQLDIERIRAIKDATNIPLVLHGGSGVPDDQIKAAIEAGICKINFGTDLCYSFLDAVFAGSRDKIAIDMFMKDVIANVESFAREKIQLLGAENRAWLKL